MVPFGSDSVTVLRAPYADRRGTKVRDWSSATSHLVDGCNVQPSGTSEQWGDARQPVRATMTLYAPYGADIEEGDRIEFDGIAYAVDGRPMRRRSPSGRISHLECRLADWSG